MSPDLPLRKVLWPTTMTGRSQQRPRTRQTRTEVMQAVPKRRQRLNPKRSMLPVNNNVAALAELAACVSYGGNPDHKSNPGDYGLQPVSRWRPGKSLCDTTAIFRKADALSHLQAGIMKGMISDKFRGKFPQHIWSVTVDGTPLEAELDNQDLGSYHGYPLLPADPFSQVVSDEWNAR